MTERRALVFAAIVGGAVGGVLFFPGLLLAGSSSEADSLLLVILSPIYYRLTVVMLDAWSVGSLPRSLFSVVDNLVLATAFLQWSAYAVAFQALRSRVGRWRIVGALIVVHLVTIGVAWLAWKGRQ